MLRYKGIPVRWQSGWKVPPDAESLMTGVRFIIREQDGYLLTFHTISRTQKTLA